MAFPGSGYLTANDVLNDVSNVLVEPVVNTTLVTPVTVPGAHTVTLGTTVSIYPGALVIIGTGGTQEVIQVTAVSGAADILATFAFVHAAGEIIVGATFPVAETADPFFTQNEMLNYLSNAQNDYLVRVPLIYARASQNFTSGQNRQSMPSDSIQMERVSYNGNVLYEQGQTSMDLLNYGWSLPTASLPTAWFEDRTGFMTYGVTPIPLNAFSLDVLYAQRDNAPLALNEGFLLPDPFLHYVKYGVLASAFSKDGEMRDPERARYCQQRFDMGVRIGKQFYENVMAQEVLNAG